MRETHRAMNLMRLLSDYSDGFSTSHEDYLSSTLGS
jgi:hypothetical protein